MKWRSTTFDWKRRFALLPILVDGHYYWWVWYWKRFACDCNEIEFTQEKPPAEVERVAEETIDDLALAIHARNRHTDLPTVRFWVQQVINQQERKGGDHHGK